MDAAIVKNTKSVGIDVIVCNHAGAMLAALSTQLLLPLGPLEAEAKAMGVAISFAEDIGLQKVTLQYHQYSSPALNILELKVKLNWAFFIFIY